MTNHNTEGGSNPYKPNAPSPATEPGSTQFTLRYVGELW